MERKLNKHKALVNNFDVASLYSLGVQNFNIKVINMYNADST